MAHFALIESGTVTNVVVVHNDDCAGGDLPASEPAGRAHLEACGLMGDWRQTSYSSSFRGVFAGVGYTWTGRKFVSPA